MRFAASHGIEPDQKTEKMREDGKNGGSGQEWAWQSVSPDAGDPQLPIFSLPFSRQAAFAFLFFSSTMEIHFIVSRRTVSEISKRAAASR